MNYVFAYLTLSHMYQQIWTTIHQRKDCFYPSDHHLDPIPTLQKERK